MKINTRVVILLAVFFLLVTISGCVTQPEKILDNKKPSQPISILDNKKPSQPISITAEYTKKMVTLFIERTDGGKLPELEAVLIDQTRKTADSHKPFYMEGVGVSSEKLLLSADSEGVYTIVVKNKLNETIYQTNWTVSFPHYKMNETVLMKNGIGIVFRPYQIGKSSQEKGVSYKRITIPIEVKNIESLKEERVRIDARSLKVDKEYTYKPLYGYVDKTLNPKEEVKTEIAFDIPEDTEPIEMRGLLGDFWLDTDFILELNK